MIKKWESGFKEWGITRNPKRLCEGKDGEVGLLLLGFAGPDGPAESLISWAYCCDRSTLHSLSLSIQHTEREHSYSNQVLSFPWSFQNDDERRKVTEDRTIARDFTLLLFKGQLWRILRESSRKKLIPYSIIYLRIYKYISVSVVSLAWAF